MRLTVCLVVTLFLTGALFASERDNAVYITVVDALSYPGFSFQGEYSGQLAMEDGGEKSVAGIQIAVYSDNYFRAVFYGDGLPGEGSQPHGEQDIIELQYTFEDYILGFSSDELPIRFQYHQGKLVGIDDKGNVTGSLERIHRKSPTLGMKPPDDALILFDGTSLDHWDDNTEMTAEGLLKQGARTARDFGDIRLHVEAKLGFMPENRGQRRTNSGIYIQNRYEVQVLDSYSLPSQINGNASLYNESVPLVNATFPPLTWQTYDVFFRAPRFDENGQKTENARVTVYLNGVLVQDDVELEKGTGAGGRREEVSKAGLYLQDHTGPVRFRNVWLVEDDVTPPGTLFISSE